MPTLTLDEFLPKARELNPDYSDTELIQAYQDRYGTRPTQTVSAAPLMTLTEFLPKARKLNPDYSDEELTAAWQEKYGARGAKESNPGFSGTILEGAKSAGRSIKAAAQTATGDLAGVEETARVESEKDPALQKLLAEIQIRKNALGKDPSWWQSAKAVGGAVVQNPKGAAMLAAEQLPNSAVALGSAGAGALAGSTLGPAGTVIGGIAGLFVGNTAIETGSKAIEKGVDGFTPEERDETLREGAIKGGVVTGFDAATFGLTKWLTGTVARAMERATINVLQREGIDTTNKAAVQAARQNPEIVAKVQQAQDTARAATNTLGKKLARGAGEVGSEAIGEGAGEYLGEVAATGKGDKVEAVIEALSGLGQSGAEIAIAQGMSRKQQQNASFGDELQVTDRTPPERKALPAPPIYGEGPVYTPTGKVEEVVPGKGRLAGLGQGTVEQYDGEVMPDMGARRLTQAPQPGEYRNGKVYGGGDVVDVSPLPDVSPVTNASSLDEAIANAVGVVQGATETAKARAAEFARMTAKAKNETDALLENAPTKRPAFDIPTLPGPEAQPATLFAQPSPIVPAQSFTPRSEPVDDPRARLAEERARMVAQREQQRLAQQENPVSEPVEPTASVKPAEADPLRSQADLIYPSSKQVRDLIHEKGLHLDTPVFREYLKQVVGKEKFGDLTPQELQQLAEKVQQIKAPQHPTQAQEAPPQVPLTPAEKPEKPYAPTTTIPEAQVPRSELTPEKSAEMLLRAEKAQADMEIAGTERGGRFQVEQQGTGGTNEVRGLKSATADWYKELTSGPSPAIRGDRKQSAREKIEAAIQKIIKDQGADRGKAVEQVKAALLKDQEFHRTEWGRDLASILEGEWPSYMQKPAQPLSNTKELQATENAEVFQNVPLETSQVTAEQPKAIKVTPSRTERLKQQKQKMEAKKPEPSPSDAPVMESQPAIAQPEREPDQPTLEAAPKTQEPKGEPFSLTAPEPSKAKAKDAGPEQLGIDIPPETIGSRPIIGREATLEEAPLFSKNAQTEDAEQTTLSEPVEKPQESHVSPKEDSGTAKEPWEMTRQEFLSSPDGGFAASPAEKLILNGKRFQSSADKDSAETYHKFNVIQPALREGKPVPPEVLADYPDIQAKEGESQPEPPQSPTDIIASALRQAADQIQGGASSQVIDTPEKYNEFRKRLLSGEVTLDEYKQAFQQVRDNKDALLAQLKKFNKDQLIKQSNSFHARRGDSKDLLIQQAYDGIVRGFALGRGVSYYMSGNKNAYEDAMSKLVGQTTAEDLAKFAEEVEQNTAEYKKRIEGVANPQTLEDFDTRVKIKGESSLTHEQLARYDELLAQAGREKRKQAQEQKATVQGVEAGTDLQMVESKHTKTGDKLWVVKLANRVDRSVYDRLNQAAHKLGGRYSSYNKDGATPGFTFRSEEAAKAFMAAGKGETVSAAPVKEAATIQVQNNAVAKLREMADSLEEKADDSLNADRKTNTARRARMAGHAENAAYGDKALAETMRNLADAIESGEATHLSGLRTKAQVEMLDSMLERAKHDRIKQETKGSYVDYERQKHRKADQEDAAFASFPELDGSKSELFSAYKDLATIKGADRLRNRFYKQAESVGEDQRVKLSREDVELAIEKYPRKSGIPWHWPESLAKIKRLESMGITSLPELRAALREFVEYRGKRGTIDKAKQLERELIGNKGIGNDFFPTPKETAQRMVAEAGIEPGMKVLEPSAGNGNIAEVIRAAGVNPDVVEQSSSLREILEAKGFNIVGQDFMDVKDGDYDRIIMNPPFSNGQDAEHIHHAYTLLNPGGKLVAIAGEGIFFRNDAKATAFRNWMEEVGGTSEKLPEGTFKDSSLMATTGVNARMVIVEKPGESEPKETDKETALYESTPDYRKDGAAHGLTLWQEALENATYAVREGEQQALNFDIAHEAIGAIDRTAAVSHTGRDVYGPRIPAKTVALGISPDLIRHGVVDLTGYHVSSAEDVAKLAQVYRDPRFETFRVFYLKDGKIVGHEGITSRLPGLVKLFKSQEDADQRMQAMRTRMDTIGADGYYLLHNHPSGESKPSAHDIALTERFAKTLPGFRGHVVIDSNEYSTLLLNRYGRVSTRTHTLDLGEDALLKPSIDHPLLDVVIAAPEDVVSIGQAIKPEAGYATVIYTSGRGGRVRSIQEVSIEYLSNPAQAATYLNKQAVAFGGQSIYISTGPGASRQFVAAIDRMIEQGVVRDYVSSHDGRSSYSRLDAGVARHPDFTMGTHVNDIPSEQVGESAAKYGRETGTIDPPIARERLKESKASLRPYLLGALGLEQLSQVYGKDHAEVRQYNKATQDMEADFTEMSRDSDKVARAWTELNIPVADKMAQVMEDARFLNFDPDPKKNQEADSDKKQELVKRFDQLPDEAKAVYRMARDFYTNMAEQRFQALKERIKRAGGTPENTKKLVDRLQIAYEQVRSKVYFPFTRFGENIVVAKQMKDGKEVDREVHAFESVAEAQKFATMMKLKGWTVKQTVAREYSVDKEGPASKIVRQMHDIIKELGQGQQGLPGVMDLENQLLDSLNQSFLQALPDMSYAKHFIHAKDVKGASRDALRSFAHSALHGAHHISRIRHADKVTQALMGLDENINETTEGDTTEARQVYNELVRRHNDIMNPNTSPVAAALGKLGFTMSLGGVVATGITNATQVPLVTYPWLGARYGFGKASASLARAYKDFLDPRTLNKDSLFDATKSKLISESERKMLLELARRGHIDLTQTMDLAGMSSQDNLSRRARLTGSLNEKVTRMLGFTFHVPEVMNRQVTALSTFRLEKEKGGSFEEAVERAQQAIIDTHFLYQAFNRPRYMSGNFLRVLTMFKQYSQNIAYTYGRAAAIWLDKNNATKEERTVAKRQLLSMLALQFGAAGALGMPFFGTPLDLLMKVVSVMSGDDDDEKRDWEVALRQWLDGAATSLAETVIDDKEQAGKVGKELAEVISHGASRLTPWDMAGRLGQNDLFFREPQREREGRQAVMDWGLALGGPVPSYAMNAFLGAGDLMKGITELNSGFFMRGVEELTPAVLRNGVKSLRYTLEGVRTRDEYKQLDLDTYEKLGQIFGFTPARVAEMYESTTAVKNKEHRVLNEQKALKYRFARAVDDQDDGAKQRILDDIRGFNERNPIFAISSNTLNRSLKVRRQREAGMERGMYLPPRRRALMDEGDFGDF